MKPKNMKQAYEWVLSTNRGNEIVLTENQYQLYKDQVKAGNTDKIFFEDLEINPIYIMDAFKREAYETKKKYPCKKCYTNGFLLGRKNAEGYYELCPDCQGTGLSLK